jgi:EAL domain-containing protein (putative c-di-GMP-specific phosphodiesterase class I)
MPPRHIRVLIADDAAIARETLAGVVASDDALELVGVAADAQEAIELATLHHPDVALIDVRMPSGGGPRATREIRRLSPSTSVIAVSAYRDERSVAEMLAGGAMSYLTKDSSLEEIAHAIRRALEGEAALSGPVAALVVSELGSRLDREEAESARRRDMETRIRGLLDGGEGLSIAYQPIAELRFGRVVGVEALARFACEPLRPPDAWFAEAAAIGLGTELEVVAARRALEALDRLPPDVFLSINMGPESVVSPRFDTALLRLPAGRVVVEITEHTPATDYPTLNRELRELRSLGVRIAVDDTGAGYASLRHILQLSPDIIKLDISITRGIQDVPANRALASALVTFAHEIGADLIAEGVESSAEAATLAELGIDLVQGFLVARPGPIPDRFELPSFLT